MQSVEVVLAGENRAQHAGAVGEKVGVEGGELLARVLVELDLAEPMLGAPSAAGRWTGIPVGGGDAHGPPQRAVAGAVPDRDDVATVVDRALGQAAIPAARLHVSETAALFQADPRLGAQRPVAIAQPAAQRDVLVDERVEVGRPPSGLRSPAVAPLSTTGQRASALVMDRSLPASRLESASGIRAHPLPAAAASSSSSWPFASREPITSIAAARTRQSERLVIDSPSPVPQWSGLGGSGDATAFGRRRRLLLHCPARCGLWRLQARAADQGITGKKLLLTSAPKLVLLSKDPSISISGLRPRWRRRQLDHVR